MKNAQFYCPPLSARYIQRFPLNTSVVENRILNMGRKFWDLSHNMGFVRHRFRCIMSAVKQGCQAFSGGKESSESSYTIC